MSNVPVVVTKWNGPKSRAKTSMYQSLSCFLKNVRKVISSLFLRALKLYYTLYRPSSLFQNTTGTRGVVL